ncbi:formyltransferase family protein [Vibrio sp. SBT000027]|uniref:formyltransferase family protein n=1 Tax=Vibrio sp. SBT000027 TaxID=1803384 RepID=UPI000EF50482|nr:formyltransferase family protein [Vibrio sp. SBT000027]RLQ15560.1 hypothetical protein AYK60_10090 [Vibrio sp. SBT000027]
MKKILFLVSGNGGNLKFVHNYFNLMPQSQAEFYCVSDRDCGGLTFCEEIEIESYKITYSRANPQNLQRIISSINPDVIITNWHKIIDPDTINLFRDKFINLHYSLLPLFGGVIGVAPIEKAYSNKCKFSGVTCHQVDEGVDTGEIISQAIFKTDIPITDAFDKSFRAGCIILLDSIFKILDYKVEISVEQYEGILFSPEVNLDLSCIDETFWNKIK